MKIELKIELAGIKDPGVWRHISVPLAITFDRLHHIIQAAFGWTNSHLYMFSENGFGDLITICSPNDEEAAIDATTVSVSQILLRMYNSRLMGGEGEKLKYIYDFGDSWEHGIMAVEFDRTSIGGAELITGGGACPPENCGGVPAFADLKKSLKTGAVSELLGEPWIPWLEKTGYPDYDPEVFDMEAAKKRLKRLGI